MRIPVNFHERKSWQAHGDILSAFWRWRAIPHPFAPSDNDCLSSVDLTDAVAALHLKPPTQHNGIPSNSGVARPIQPAGLIIRRDAYRPVFRLHGQ
jgi:hypothetical protein